MDRVELAVAEIIGFHRRFGSMEYVDSQLVLRLTDSPPPARPGSLEKDFADLGTDRPIVERGALIGEFYRPELTGLPFPFNCRSLGRLRQLIDALNRDGN